MQVVTISSCLNFGGPAPPGRGSAAERKFLAPPYYSQCAVFASLSERLFHWSCRCAPIISGHLDNPLNYLQYTVLTSSESRCMTLRHYIIYIQAITSDEAFTECSSIISWSTALIFFNLLSYVSVHYLQPTSWNCRYGELEIETVIDTKAFAVYILLQWYGKVYQQRLSNLLKYIQT